ncbi:hypothetical protein I315_01698 [Cryptococcus gattii Ru294]|uniref:Uncharacterized protein n=1 Tax=Cryptococcus gattii EJB2 TaxID=1296103 RepID=A0ABR5BNM8_9TREE|nr:hypothetical protein I315_01698 [Cryptococcus gattii Ru294]KIR77242.1 hypothetical protein I306_05696 [Cryptococcus gattii EJB2]KIY36332.1 hypothetical protein I305_01193 [Cryptococcus gattii E566]KJE06017.1 hypothetical protein I311_00153 [Cryptococcus gattii NT-10]
MNTAGSVAYGWGALIVAAGVSFYYAKKEIDSRRKEAQIKGTRPMEKLSWEERIAREQQQGAQSSSIADQLKQASVNKPSGGT